MRLTSVLIALLINSCSSPHREKDVNNINVDFNKEWNYSDPVGTRERFKTILKNAEDKDLDYRLQLKTQIARTHSLRAEFEEAHKILDEVKNKLNDKTVVAKVRYLLERGRTYNSANKKQEAKEQFISAFELGKDFNLASYTIDAAHMIAIAESDLDEKIAWSKNGIEIAKNSPDKKVKGWIGVFYNNTGWDLFEAKRYEEALNHFVKCKEFHQEMGNKDNENIAKWSIAKTYRYLGKLEDSLNIQEKLLAQANGLDKSGYIYEELGELYLLLKQQEKARDFFSKAYKVLSQDTWLLRNEADRLNRMKRLSQQE